MFVVLGALGATPTLTALLRRVGGVRYVRETQIFEGSRDRRRQRLEGLLDPEGRTLEELDADMTVGLVRPNLLGRPKAHAQIAKLLPSSKLVVVLRHPVQRAIAAYFHYMRDELIPIEEPDVGLARILAGLEPAPRADEVLAFSSYSTSLLSLLEHFDRERVHLTEYGELWSDPARVVGEVLSFLGVAVPEQALQDVVLPEPTPQEEPPGFVGEVVMARAARRLQRGDPEHAAAELDLFLRRPAPTTRPARLVSARTWDALWQAVLPETKALPEHFPETAPMVRRWLADAVQPAGELPAPRTPLRRHPRKLSSSYGRHVEFCIGLVEGPSLEELRWTGGPLLTGRDAAAPGSAYVADPYLVVDGDERYVFYESRTSPNALLEVAGIDADGAFHPLGVAVEEPFHLSYPQVFRHQGEWFMTVESVQAGRLIVYRATEFPTGWERASEPIEGTFTDPSPFFWEGRLHVLATTPGGLQLLTLSDDLTTAEPHPSGLIPCEPEHRRMGGGVFVLSEGTYRVSQRGTHAGESVYGVCLDLHRLTELTGNAYAEEVAVAPFLPRPGVLDQEEWAQRVHHLHVVAVPGGLVGVIDGRDRRGLFSDV